MAKRAGSKPKELAVNTARLRTWNLWLAGIYAVQGLLLILLSNSRVFPVHISYPTADPIASEVAGHSVVALASRHLFDIHLSYVLGATLLLAALMCGLAATIYRAQYEAGIQKGANTACWIGFALCASILAVAIAAASGATDVSVLVFIVLSIAIGSGVHWAVGRLDAMRRQPVGRILNIAAMLALLVPLMVYVLSAWATNTYGSNDVPSYVYGVYASLVGFAAAYMLVKRSQRQNVGKWADQAYGERSYLILGAVACSGLAWQLYMGALRS